MADAQTPVLAPCPFCGIPARPVRHSAGMRGTIGYDQWHGVSCIGCNACVGATDRRFRTVEEAAAAWNQRAAQAPAQPAEPVAWAATSDAGEVEALGMNQSRRFDTPLYFAAPSHQDRAVMQQALETIIALNVQYAIDRYGDASQAESMECVRVARAALSATMEKP